MHVDAREHGIQNLAADVIKIHIDAAWAGCAQILIEVAFFVIDDGVKTEFIDQATRFFCAAGNSHHAAAMQFGKLRSEERRVGKEWRSQRARQRGSETGSSG